MSIKKHKLFELLVVGGSLWFGSACGSAILQQPSPGSTQPRTLSDRGVPDGGQVNPGDGHPPGGGSGFW